MFGDDFWPTPLAVGHRLREKVSKDAKYILEPSAGKGNLAELFKSEPGYYGSGRNYEVDCIESNPELVQILVGKGLKVVGFDWLTYDGVCYYDAIVMNPPFSAGAEHLLRAWDFMYHGQVICLLNAETINNPCTQERQKLARVIAEHGGEVVALGQPFKGAERATAVEVVMVVLKKEAKDDRIELWAKDGQERKIDEHLSGEEYAVAVQDQLGNLEQWYQLANEQMLAAFAHLRKAQTYMTALGVHFERDDLKNAIGMALGNMHSARSEFLRAHRKAAWKGTLGRMEFHKWLDRKQADQMIRDIETTADVPFTAANIRGTLQTILAERGQIFEQSCANVFDELCKHHKGNGSSEGWATNDSYKVNQKIVFPYGCRFEKQFGRHFEMLYGSSGIIDIYNDLDRVTAVMDGTSLDKVTSIGAAMNNAFQALGHAVASPFDNTCESTYFEIKFWMKGTVHLKWKREDLWVKFNQLASKGKLWLGEQTQKRRA